MLESDTPFTYAFFDDEKSAAAAVQQLLDHDFDSEHIGVLMRDATGAKEVQLDHKTGVGPGAAIGSLLGVVAGAVALPATGLLAIGGAFAALSGAAVGGAGGTLLGVLGGLGLWKEQHAVPHAAFDNGSVLVGAVASPERINAAKSALAAAGARDMNASTHLEAEKKLVESPAVPTPGHERNVNPDKVARNVFLLTIAYVVAVAGSIWLFIGPV